MKRMLKSTPLILLVTVILLSFNLHTASGIKGTVTPAENAGTVWAVNGSDSLKVVPDKGVFSFDAKPGTYTVIVEATAPYKSFVKEAVVIGEGETVDLGVITLEK